MDNLGLKLNEAHCKTVFSVSPGDLGGDLKYLMALEQNLSRCPISTSVEFSLQYAFILIWDRILVTVFTGKL